MSSTGISKKGELWGGPFDGEPFQGVAEVVHRQMPHQSSLVARYEWDLKKGKWLFAGWTT